MSLSLDSRYAISEKPREKGRDGWPARSPEPVPSSMAIGQAATSTPEPEASEPTDEGHHSSEDGDEERQARHMRMNTYQPIGPYLIKWSLRRETPHITRSQGPPMSKSWRTSWRGLWRSDLEDDGAEPVRMVTLDATLISGKRFPEIRDYCSRILQSRWHDESAWERKRWCHLARWSRTVSGTRSNSSRTGRNTRSATCSPIWAGVRLAGPGATSTLVVPFPLSRRYPLIKPCNGIPSQK